MAIAKLLTFNSNEMQKKSMYRTAFASKSYALMQRKILP